MSCRPFYVVMYMRLDVVCGRWMVLGLRMLDGQVHSFNQCKRLHIEPGSRSFAPDLIPTIRKFLVCGLSMITGAVPPSTLIPYLKVLCHYADQADLAIWHFAMVCVHRTLACVYARATTPRTPSIPIQQVLVILLRDVQPIHQKHVL